jgi:hypothetical protein
MQVVTYEAARERFVTGDVVTFDGDTLLGMAIRHFAGPGTHTAMVVRLQDAPGRLFLLEALEHGLALTRMSRRVSNYDGRVFVTTCPATLQQREKMTELALCLIGSQVRYDYLSLFRNAWRRVPLSMGRGYCTESVQYIHQAAGVLTPQAVAMVPGDYLKLPWSTVQLAAYTAEGE